MFRVLAIGDIVGPEAAEYLRTNLWNYRKRKDIQLTVVNGENSSIGNGIDPTSADMILQGGADVITTGNHVWKKREIKDYLDSTDKVIRPANYPPQAPGNGYTVVRAEGRKILVINVLGTIFMEALLCPFETIEKILIRESGNYDYSVLDIHAEATSEKLALGKHFDGRINVIFGTHTHIATADLRILPHGTGYITDLGMSGPQNGILGVRTDCVIDKLKLKMPVKFELADGTPEMYGAIFTLDDFRVVDVESVKF